MPIVRDYFPGNNTPMGFFSYYKYIICQENAEKIVYIKGGPGTGKSTLMKKIGQAMVDANRDVDFLHCSADEESIDAIVIDKKIAFIDGTSPHVGDPIMPGAIDSILDLGAFWDTSKLKDNKYRIMTYSKESKNWYVIAYNYLASAKKIYDSLNYINSAGMEQSDVDKLSNVIINREMNISDYSFNFGSEKMAFATAITSSGIKSHLKTLLCSMDKVYFVNSPEGLDNCIFFNKIKDAALRRGIDVESYYCPMNPLQKIEHLIIPKLKVAVVTCNKWHDIEPWEIYKEENEDHEIIMLDIEDYISSYYKEKNLGIIQNLSKEYSRLINFAINSLSRAKENHDIVEQIYMKNMDFIEIDKLTQKYIEALK